MAKVKVHEIAKEFDIKSSEVVAILAKMGIEGKAPASGLEDDQVEALRRKLSGKDKAVEVKEEKKAPVKSDAAKPEAKPEKRPAGAVPVKKKKPIIVVSSARNSQMGNRGMSQGAGRGTSSGPVRQGGIIRPTVPTTAERAARSAETVQGGDKDRLRRAGVTPKKENPEVNKTDVNTAGSSSSSTGGSAGAAGAQKPAEPKSARPAKPAGTAPERGAKPERQRGGIVINQGRGFNASSEPSKDNRRGGSERKGNVSKDKSKKDRIYENEDGFKGGKQVKGKGTKMPMRPVEKKEEPEEEKIKVITLPETITIKELADKMKIQQPRRKNAWLR